MKKKIFVIDDEKDSLQLIKVILSKRGYEVKTSTDAGIIGIIKEDCADLIILDVNLGIKDGDEICGELKSNSETRQIPVILVSAMKELPEIALQSGADDYLFKPFNKSQLIKKVEQHTQAFRK